MCSVSEKVQMHFSSPLVLHLLEVVVVLLISQIEFHTCCLDVLADYLDTFWFGVLFSIHVTTLHTYILVGKFSRVHIRFELKNFQKYNGVWFLYMLQNMSYILFFFYNGLCQLNLSSQDYRLKVLVLIHPCLSLNVCPIVRKLLQTLQHIPLSMPWIYLFIFEVVKNAKKKKKKEIRKSLSLFLLNFSKTVAYFIIFSTALLLFKIFNLVLYVDLLLPLLNFLCHILGSMA